MNRVSDFFGIKVKFPVEQPRRENTSPAPAKSVPPNPASAKIAAEVLRAARNSASLLPATVKTSIAPPANPLIGAATLLSPTGAPPTDPHKLPHVDDPQTGMPYYDQGDKQACGTTSLSMILKYLGVDIKPGDIDKEIRRVDSSIGTSVDDIIDFARAHGVEAEGYNNGTWDEIKNQIDQGHPVMVSVKGDGEVKQLPDGRHLIAITGYGKDPDGKEYVLYHDPNKGDEPGSKGAEQRLSLEDFQKAWSKEDFGVKNYFIAFAPKGSKLPAGRNDGAEGALGVHNGVTNIQNGFDRIFSPDNFGSVVHGIPQLIGGAVQTAGSFVGGLLQLGASKLKGLVEKVPVLRDIANPIADIVSGAGGAVANVFTGFGHAANSVGSAFEALAHGKVGRFFEGMGKAVTDFGGGVVKAGIALGKGVVKAGISIGKSVVGAVKTVGKAIGSVPKGIGKAVSGAVKAVGNAAKGVANAAGNVAKGAVNAVSNVAKGAVNTVKKIFSGW
jgi:uncharacterized protein YvpB